MRGVEVKQILLLTVSGLVVAGCCSTQNELQHLSTSDLQLRGKKLMYCLTMMRMIRENHRMKNSPYAEVRNNLKKKKPIEQKIPRREVTNYHWPPSVTYQYIHDHCNCQDW